MAEYAQFPYTHALKQLVALAESVEKSKGMLAATTNEDFCDAISHVQYTVCHSLSLFT